MEKLSISPQWRSYLKYCAQHAKHGIVDELDCGVAVYWTQGNIVLMNGFFFSSVVLEEEDLRRRLEAIKTYVMKAQSTVPWALFIEPDSIASNLCERLHDICLADGFVCDSDLKCMQTSRLLPPIRSLPIAEVKFATSEREVREAVLLNVQANNFDASATDSVMESHAVITDLDKELCCIVSVDGKPVATATTMPLGDCLYVGWVATSPDYRKHGYGELAVRTSIERALQKFPHKEQGIILDASKMGQPLYARMGFKDFSHIGVYIHEPAAQT